MVLRKVDTLIVGGGLAGLALARALSARGQEYRLIEARDRLGGRILSRTVRDGPHAAAFDLGPAWFWPGQARIAALIEALGLEVFAQYARGQLTAEDERGRVVRGAGLAAMEGSLRVVGGLGAVVDALHRELPPERLATGCEALAVGVSGAEMRTETRHRDGRQETLASARVVLAVPPRVAAARIDLGGAISVEAIAAMREIPTWMAGHAKVVAVYARPFWREAGLSGDAMSRRGPLVEVHDASPAHGGPYALFGFVGVPVHARRDAGALGAAAKAQLVRLFGSAAAAPLELVVQDWAFESETATRADHPPLHHHPVYGLPPMLRNPCGGRLLLGSTEAAPEHGGYLEGALCAAEHVARLLTPT